MLRFAENTRSYTNIILHTQRCPVSVHYKQRTSATTHGNGGAGERKENVKMQKNIMFSVA